MSFYGRASDALQSVSDESYSDDTSNSSGSDSAEDDGMMRSYHIGPPSSGLGLGMSEPAGLATIAEDAEEDSGGESSSGHWLFSADNTDTDSVIHVPPPFTLASSLPVQYEHEIDPNSSSSEETLVASEDEVIKYETKNINCEIRNETMMENDNNEKGNDKIAIKIDNSVVDGRKEKCDDSNREIIIFKNFGSGCENAEKECESNLDNFQQVNKNVWSSSHTFDKFNTNQVVDISNHTFDTADQAFHESDNTTDISTHIFDKSNSGVENLDSNFDKPELVIKCSTRGLNETAKSVYKIDDSVVTSFIKDVSGEKCFQTSENIPTQMDDLFDFSSLETCEEVSMGSFGMDTGCDQKDDVNECGRDDYAVFTTSATSEPFCSNFRTSESVWRKSNKKLPPLLELTENAGTETDYQRCNFDTSDQNSGNQKNLEAFDQSVSALCELEDTQEYEGLNVETYSDRRLSSGSDKRITRGRESAIGYSFSSSDEDNHMNNFSSSDRLLKSARRLQSNPDVEKKKSCTAEQQLPFLENRAGPSCSSSVSSVSNSKVRQKRPQRTSQRLRARTVFHHAGNTDGDTDDTDGDFEEEKYLKKRRERKTKKDIRTSSTHQTSTCRTSGEKEAELEFYNHPQSSPEMPSSRGLSVNHQISASYSASGARYVEKSAKKKLGEENIQETLNLSDASNIVDSNKVSDFCLQSQKEICQLRLSRPLSLGDLRYYYSDSDPEEEIKRRRFSEMKTKRVKSAVACLPCPVPSSPNYAACGETHNVYPKDIPQNIFKNDAHVYNLHKGVSSRHDSSETHNQNLYRQENSTPQRENRDHTSRALVTKPNRRNTQRPKPLSLDMAEEFLTQEGLLKSPVKIYNPYADKQIFSHPKAVNNVDNTVMSNSEYTAAKGSTSSGYSTSSGLYPTDGIMQNELRIATHSSSTPDLSDEATWLSARNQPLHPLPALPLNSCEPQLPFSFGPSGLQKCSLLPEVASRNTSHSNRSCEEGSRLNRNGENTTALPVPNPDMAETVTRIRTKTYGPHGEVEVYLAKKGDSTGQSPPAEERSVTHPRHGGGSRGVTFSPSVKEVNWRESYTEQDDNDFLYTPMETKNVQKVTVKSSESPPPQKFTPTMMSSYSHSPHVYEVSGSKSYSENSKESDAKIPQITDSVNVQQCDTNFSVQSRDHYIISDTPPPLQQPPTPESPRSPTPIWQRLKLVKIGSPKGPRPAVPPKPPSLSPRSSDGENTKVSSSSSPESGLSSPSSPEFKFKKIPTSPRFFSWGSKKDRKNNKSNGEIVSQTKTDSFFYPSTPTVPPQVSTSLNPSEDHSQVKCIPTQVESPFISDNSLTVNSKAAFVTKEKESKKMVANRNLSLGSHPTEESFASKLRRSFGKSNANHKEKNGYENDRKSNFENEKSDFLKTRDTILKQIKTGKHNVKKEAESNEAITNKNRQNLEDKHHEKVLTSNMKHDMNSVMSPSAASLSPSSDSDSFLDDHSSAATSDSKPPLPPSFHNRGTSQILGKARVIHARRQYLTQQKPPSSSEESDKKLSDQNLKQEPKIGAKIPLEPQLSDPLPPVFDSDYNSRSKSASERLKERFERFSKATRAERERLARSTPDLSQIEESVRRQTPRIDSSGNRRLASSPHSGSDGDAAGLSSSARGLPLTREEVRSPQRSSLRGGEAPHRSTFNRVSAEFERLSQRNRTRSVGLLETDLDTGASREFLTPQETNLDDLYQDLQNFLDSWPQGQPFTSASTERAKAKSLLQLDATADGPKVMESSNLTATRSEDSRAKSMEFLLDDENRASVQAPENELMKEGERKLSEAELRVRRSLQRLDVPEWMKTANTQQGFILRRRDHTTGGTSGGWSAYSSKTGSMTSLGSSRANTPNNPFKVVIPTRASTRSYGGITSPSSTTSISPSPSERGYLFQYPLSRWSTSRINSGSNTPTGSFTSQKPTSYARQPYLGWRSNTSLASLGGSQSSLMGHTYLSPAERLALTILPSQRQKSTPKDSCGAQQNAYDISDNTINQKIERIHVADVHSSIKEVTSAIVHYCKETASPHPSPRGSPNPSPRRLVWVESSFVGTRPITSPETPTTTASITPPPVNGHQEDVVDTKPPHSTEVFSLANSFTNIQDGSKDSPGASTNDSTAVLPDNSRGDSGNSIDDNRLPLESQQNALRSSRGSQSENDSRHSTVDTINSAVSSRGFDSLNSRNSGGSSMSRDSSASRHSSSGRGASSSREDLPPPSVGSSENIPEPTGDELEEKLHRSSHYLSTTDESTLTASCHSSFGTFQMDDESLIKVSEAKPTITTSENLQITVESSFITGDTRQTKNSRRFSEGSNPWEPTQILPYSNRSKKLDDTWEVEDDDQGYGFNFSSHTKKNLFPDANIEKEEFHAESATLEDVLDSLLALPSASRSPSPSGPHPLSMARPASPHSFLSNEASRLTHDQSDSRLDDSRYSYLRNHNLGPDLKTQSYHKSFSYATSSFAPSSSFQQKFDKYDSESQRSRSITSQDDDKTFCVEKDEGDVTSTRAVLPSLSNRLNASLDMQNTFSYKPDKSKYLTQSTTTAMECPKNVSGSTGVIQPLSSFSQTNFSQYKQKDWNEQYNISNQFGPNSCRSDETLARRASMEDETQKTIVSSSFLASNVKEPFESATRETKVTFHLPPKHMNIPPDSSSENGNGSENLTADIEDDDDAPSTSDHSGMLVHCRNNLCSNSTMIEDARINYKTCHNCSVFYCSRTCRRSHWEKHKKMCEKIRASTAARDVIERIKQNSAALEAMSSVARRGSLAIGRGAVKIFFPDTAAAEKFVSDRKIPEAHYQAVQNIMPQELGSEVYKKTIEQCRNYNPDIKFILYVSICTFSETPTGSSVKCRRETVGKCAKLRLAEQNQQSTINILSKSSVKSNLPEHHVITRDLNEPETLLLTVLSDINYGLPPRQAREVVFSNIVRELQERGVDLRMQYADVYKKLAHYVDVGSSFPPLTIYPKDSGRGSSFMCIIMPEADPAKLQRLGSDSSKVRTVDISRPHPAIT